MTKTTIGALLLLVTLCLGGCKAAEYSESAGEHLDDALDEMGDAAASEEAASEGAASEGATSEGADSTGGYPDDDDDPPEPDPEPQPDP